MTLVNKTSRPLSSGIKKNNIYVQRVPSVAAAETGLAQSVWPLLANKHTWDPTALQHLALAPSWGEASAPENNARQIGHGPREALGL